VSFGREKASLFQRGDVFFGTGRRFFAPEVQKTNEWKLEASDLIATQAEIATVARFLA